MACSVGNNNPVPPTPLPTAYTWITNSPWTIQSVTFMKSDGSTDSLYYTSPDSLGNSRLIFYFSTINNTIFPLCTFADAANSTWIGPMNDTTVFRYFNNGIWSFDQNWANEVNADNTSLKPDSLSFQATYITPTNVITFAGPFFSCKINHIDSLHIQFTYLDTSIVNPVTKTKYSIVKAVSLVPAPVN
jgi:hypothetical protein